MAEGNKNPNWRVGKALEKSNFAQTCTLLSQFLKEKRATEVGLSANNKSETKAAGTNTQSAPAEVSPVVKSPNFFHQLVSPSSNNIEDSNKPDPRKTTSTKVESSQMTIFYAGQVLTFNDLPSDKADEVMALARKGSSSSSNLNNSTSVSVTTVKEKIDSANIVININESPADPDENSNLVIQSKSSVEPKSNGQLTVNKKFPTLEPIQERPAEAAANGSDLPIARRNSLHRFLEKRKDRVAAKAPYQVNNRPVMAPPKPADEGNQWSTSTSASEGHGGEGECSEQLELKL
ncbi:jasmonate ZIM domain-containing protein 1-like isoform X2 [Humulus lupulus]|uniref:jasmonate ZIM domain-containing protein 1-like isoform X2 n=1 Tax=Humulus lupulus TaxID=3486 RepID=UPI002B40F4DA|nr:jasmonate ZIM domain-containing protein 1-like isoform X2 [Humulus lupulus]